MFFNLRKKIARAKFDRQIKDIVDTPPVPVVDAAWTVVSMVAKSDVLMYLLSMKAFYRKLGAGKLVAVIDRDTPDSATALLSRHFPGIQFVILEDIDAGRCQRGGTWERLVYVVRRSAEEFVIQVDCDTLVIGADIAEIHRCVAQNIPFAYADNDWSIMSLREIAADAQTISSPYIGIFLERCFATWPQADQWKYVRASSGLAGFARGGASLDLLEQFHDQMKASLGTRWREWGTEQSGSNFVIANSPGAITLPFPEYATYPLEHGNERTKFFHFIGSNRFRGDYFAQQGRRLIQEMMAVRS